jgi:pimeloyl-ACP methyl ester carboxylesterase
VAALTPRVVATARGPIEVAETGTGPAVLVVHGLPGDWRQARPIAEDLGGEARVLLVTRPGYGRTPLRSGRTPQEQADLYAALLDALDIDRAVVVGISGGGPSSYAFAAGHADRCDGLLLCCALTPHLMTPPAAMRRLAAVPGLWRALAAIGRQTGRFRQALDTTGFTARERELLGSAQITHDLQRFTRERRHTLRGAGLRNDGLQIAAQREIPWPAGNDVPTVVLHGDTDPIVPLLHGEAYAATTGARLEVLEDHGHAVPLFARERVAALLRELISSARARPTRGTA